MLLAEKVAVDYWGRTRNWPRHRSENLRGRVRLSWVACPYGIGNRIRGKGNSRRGRTRSGRFQPTWPRRKQCKPSSPQLRRNSAAWISL